MLCGKLGTGCHVRAACLSPQTAWPAQGQANYPSSAGPDPAGAGPSIWVMQEPLAGCAGGAGSKAAMSKWE